MGAQTWLCRAVGWPICYGLAEYLGLGWNHSEPGLFRRHLAQRGRGNLVGPGACGNSLEPPIRVRMLRRVHRTGTETQRCDLRGGRPGCPRSAGWRLASDTAGRSWARMCPRAPFGPRTGVACATVPGNPLVLVVAGGVSDDVHRDLWVSQDGGVTFSMLSLTMPLGVGLMKWPPHLLCASRAINGRLGLWCLRLNLGDAVTAELEPLDEFSQSFDSEWNHELPKAPRFGLDLEANAAISFDKTANLQAQSLPDLKLVSSPSPWDCENLPLEKMSCHVPPDSCWVVCDMDAAHTRGHGKIYVLTEDRCFASDRQQYRAQDHFVKLLGFRLQLTHGLPMDLWLGRVRPCLLPRPRRFAGLAAN